MRRPRAGELHCYVKVHTDVGGDASEDTSTRLTQTFYPEVQLQKLPPLPVARRKLLCLDFHSLGSPAGFQGSRGVMHGSSAEPLIPLLPSGCYYLQGWQTQGQEAIGDSDVSFAECGEVSADAEVGLSTEHW